jgi:tetratricopeptide (TPR) repeat protein
MLRFAGLFSLLVAMPASALANQCTMAQLAISPFLVIEPCTRRLELPDLGARDKSFAHLMRGRGYHRTQRLDEAARDYRQAFELDSKNADILVLWSNVDLRQKRFRDYKARVEQALELDPNNPRVLRNAGTMFSNIGDPDKAMEFYDRALRADPREPLALYYRTELLQERRKFKEAIADADALVAIPRRTLDEYSVIDPDGTVKDFHVAALLRRAEILEAAGQRDLAAKDLDAAVAIERSARTLIPRGWFLHYEARRKAEALTDLEEAVRLDPDDHSARYAFGILLTDAKRFEEAFSAFDRAVKMHPSRGLYWKMRARMHRQFGRTDEAVADLETAITRDPRELPQVLASLRSAGYWTSRQEPRAMTAEFRDAVRACMLDERCN